MKKTSKEEARLQTKKARRKALRTPRKKLRWGMVEIMDYSSILLYPESPPKFFIDSPKGPV